MIKRILISGQSMFEVMFAVGIAALVLIAIVSLSTQAVKTSDFSKNNALATKYAQEGVELVRQKRDESDSWVEFTLDGTRLGQNIPLGGSDLNTPNPMSANPLFSRTMIMDYERDLAGNPISTDWVLVAVTVTWTDSGGEHKVESTTKLSNWRD